MLYFLNPIWLAAAAGVIVPVVIHLWNIRQGKVLRIGSTMLLAGAVQKSASSLRISQWLLLVLRCLLIIFLAVILAGPQWQTSNTTAGKGWILVKRAEISAITAGYKNSIDSLLKAGFEVHDFSSGFPAISLSDSTLPLTARRENDSMNVSRTNITENQSPWQLLRSLDTKLPAGYPVYVFTKPLLLREMQLEITSGGSTRPLLSLDLHWQYLPSDKNDIAELLYVKQQPDGQFRTLTIHSNDMASWFSNTIAGTASSTSSTSSTASTSSVSSQSSKSSTSSTSSVSSQSSTASTSSGSSQSSTFLQPDTGTLRITIFHDDNTEAANYLEAAVRAVASFSHQKLQITITRNAAAIAAGQQWIFWLSEKTIPASVEVLGQNLLHYANTDEPAVTSNTRFTSDDGPVGPDPIRLYKSYSVVPVLTDSIVWQDDQGHMILGKKTDPSKIWQLYTRLDTDWSDLAWSPAFPKMIAALIMNGQPEIVSQPFSPDPKAYKSLSTINDFDKRILPLEEVNPVFAVETYKEKQTGASNMNLEKLCWIILFLLFASERIISYYQKKLSRI